MLLLQRFLRTAIFLSVWFGVLAVGYLAGVRGVFADPPKYPPGVTLPPCVECACKEVNAWWVTGATVARSVKQPGTTTGALYAPANPITTAGGCNGGPSIVDGMVLVDIWQHNQSYWVCKTPNLGGTNEVTLVDPGFPFDRDRPRRQCTTVNP